MHINKCGWPEEKYFSLHYLGHCFKWVNQLDQAINTALEAMKIFPQWALAYFDLGEYYSHKGDYRKTIEWTLTGFSKEKPKSYVYFVNDLDYSVFPLGRLADAYLQVGEYLKAYQIAKKLVKENPKDKLCQELLDTCKKVLDTEDFVQSFVKVAETTSNIDRLKAIKLFDLLPSRYDEDIRIQQARFAIVPPYTWPSKSIVFYCHKGFEEWAYPSIFTGLGGSEEAVVYLSEQFVKMGYKVVVYNYCGDMRGTYNGVEYRPYYHFNPQDIFNILVIWRYPPFCGHKFKAKKVYLWLHDIVSKELFNERILENVDKILFLSKWHRNNVPDLPDEKCYITNNGIDPSQFLQTPKRRPNSLLWTSSYDRGLVTLGRDILPLIEKEIPSVTLDVCYGTGNLEKEMDTFPHLKDIYNECQKIFKKPNVIHHGRISHKEVADLAASSMVLAYSSEFGETNNISSQKAQAAGCYVITTSQAGATPERIRFGKVVQGNNIYTDKKLQEKYAQEVIKFLKNPKELSLAERKKIAEEFSWETTAKQWQKDLLD
jgi:glycosyltransferase involved in cell wall biosynthesis